MGNPRKIGKIIKKTKNSFKTQGKTLRQKSRKNSIFGNRGAVSPPVSSSGVEKQKKSALYVVSRYVWYFRFCGAFMRKDVVA